MPLVCIVINLSQVKNVIFIYIFENQLFEFMKKLFALSLLLSITMSSCSDAVIEEVVIVNAVTYNTDVRTIISNNCLPCHAGSSPSAGLNLETYANVKAAAENGNLLTRINSASNPMPQGGQMSPTLIATIEKWAADGYIEN